jgi:hypothetical protein
VAYFFDDDWRNIQDVQKACPPIHTELMSTRPVDPPPFCSNGYSALLERIGIRPKCTEGFTREANLVQWAESGTAHKAVFFDWDQTLSQYEGIYCLNPLAYGLTFRDLAEYLTGGAERLGRLQAMFNRLHLARVEIYIVTNNPVCGSPAPVGDFGQYGVPPLLTAPPLTEHALFQGIVDVICPAGIQLCYTGSLSKYDRNKGHWIREHLPRYAVRLLE